MCRRWKDVHHAQGVPQGVPRGRGPVYKDSDASMAQVAKDFGISPSCLKRWLSIDERGSTRSSGSSKSGSESDALREANKRIKLLEQENEVLRRAAAYLSQAHLPGK